MSVRIIFLFIIFLSVLPWACGQEQPATKDVAAISLDSALDQTLTVDQLSAIHFGKEPAGKWLPYRVTLQPAQWIWLPSERTLPNTFVLFRKEFTLPAQPVRATGWLTADSRYRLTVNGQRVQWGPAPCDPRQLDVDPLDITALLRPGKNVVAVEVLYYGIGEGTWAAGKPGLLFHAVIETPPGDPLRIVSDSSWQCTVDRAHPPAQPKRWFLRALQEEFDARQHPSGLGYTRVHTGRALGGSHVAIVPARQATVLQFLQHDRFARPGGTGCECLARAADSTGPRSRRACQRIGR